MPYTSALVGSIFVVRWDTSPVHPDGSNLLTELEHSRRRAGRMLTNLSIVPPTITAPEDKDKDGMLKRRHVWTETCESVHVVVQGDGFKHSIVRSVIAGISLGFTKRGFLHVHRSFDDAVRAIAKQHNEEPGALLRRLQAVGFEAPTHA